MEFTDFEKGILESAASLAKVTFEKDVCTVWWDFVAEYTSIIRIRLDEDGEFFITIINPNGSVELDDESGSFSRIVSLLRELDTSLLSIIAEQLDEDSQGQGLLS